MIAYKYTVGLFAESKNMKRAQVKVCFKIDGTKTTATVESANTMATISRLSKKVLVTDVFNDMVANAKNSIDFARTAFELFGLEICGE
jgi:hypothetical protein